MVQRLQFSVRAWDVAGGGVLGWDDLRMDHLPSLEEVYVELWYRSGDEVQHVAAALRRERTATPTAPPFVLKEDQVRAHASTSTTAPAGPLVFGSFLQIMHCTRTCLT